MKPSGPTETINSSLRGLVFALCCHHKCTWKDYVGHDVWNELGFNNDDFHLMTLMSSWATCRIRSATESDCRADGEADQSVKHPMSVGEIVDIN